MIVTPVGGVYSENRSAISSTATRAGLARNVFGAQFLVELKPTEKTRSAGIGLSRAGASGFAV
jgi:hypothetical protein